jgi:membrane-associated phospholipid phosphatase
MVLLVFYRWTAWFTVPIGTLVAFSRIYNGVHYPSDVVAGAIIGAGTAAVILWAADTVWGWARLKGSEPRQTMEKGSVEARGLKGGE